MEGRGTRLYPLTKLRCKPAVPLAGKYRLVDIPISNCINSGIIAYICSVSLIPLLFIATFRMSTDLTDSGRVLWKFFQPNKLNTVIIGIKELLMPSGNLIHFGANDDDLFVILSGDQLYRMDFQKWSKSI